MIYKEYSHIFKALSDDKRLKIIDLLSNGSLCACKILEHFDFSQPALSQHMKVLTECGLVTGNRKGNWMHYSLVDDKFEKIGEFIGSLVSISKDDNAECEICK